MRKIIPFVVLLSLIVLPMIASAQIKECCILSKEITIGTDTCTKGTIPAPSLSAAKVCKSDVTEPDDGAESGEWCKVGDSWGMFCMINTLYRITDWISYIIFAIVGVMVIIGAFEIVTAGGNPEKVTSGRNYILYAVIGMVVAFFAKAIPALVKAMVGM